MLLDYVYSSCRVAIHHYFPSIHLRGFADNEQLSSLIVSFKVVTWRTLPVSLTLVRDVHSFHVRATNKFRQAFL